VCSDAGAGAGSYACSNKRAWKHTTLLALVVWSCIVAIITVYYCNSTTHKTKVNPNSNQQYIEIEQQQLQREPIKQRHVHTHTQSRSQSTSHIRQSNQYQHQQSNNQNTDLYTQNQFDRDEQNIDRDEQLKTKLRIAFVRQEIYSFGYNTNYGDEQFIIQRA
jgi:hypothetical protein